MRRSALFLLLSAHSCLAFVPALMVRPGLSCRGGRAVGGHGGRLGAAMRSNTRTARAGITSARMGTSIPSVDVSKTVEFVQSVLAVGDEMPDAKELELAAGLLCMQGQTVMLPSERDGLHPLVLPMCKDGEGCVTGLLKLPLKPATDLPVVRTTGKHLELLSPSLQQLIKRTVVQMEFDEDAAAAEVRSAAEKLGITVEAGVKGSPFGLERFILVKVGPFADMYEWLANDWMGKGKTEEALITCARAAGLIPEWGAIHWTHSKIITKVGGREMEARDCARAALQMPLWTIGPDLKQVIASAESTEEKMKTSYEKWSTTGGPEENFVNTGISDQQIALGKANYLMDTVVLNDSKTWESIRDTLAQHFIDASLPETARLVKIK